MLKMYALEAGAGELHCLAGEVQRAPSMALNKTSFQN